MTKRLEVEELITTADMKGIRYKESPDGTQKGNEDLYRQSNMLTVVQVINKNKLRWFGHVMRREEESTLRVVMGREID